MEKKCIEKFEINGIVIGEAGDVLKITDAIPLNDETLEDVEGYCNIKNKRTKEVFEACWCDIPGDGETLVTLMRGTDITGQKFGHLTAIEQTAKRQGQHVVWMCECDCGNTAFVNANNLQRGVTKSCGCRRKDKALNR